MKHDVPSLPVPAVLLAALAVPLALPVPALAQTDDGGWIPLGPRLGQPAESLALVPGSPGTLLAATDQGSYRGPAGGPWTTARPGPARRRSSTAGSASPGSSSTRGTPRHCWRRGSSARTGRKRDPS